MRSIRDISKIAGLIAPLAVFLVLGCGVPAAADNGDLYRATAIVTGQREETRVPGMAQCLEDVLVKVSGDPRLRDDPRVAAITATAPSFVVAHGYRDRMAGIPTHDEQGTRDRPYDLTVRFDPAKVDAALRALDHEPWTAPRPRLVVLLGVRNAVTSYVLAGDGNRGRDQREALAAAAERFGMPMTLPRQRALSDAGLTFDSLPVADPARLEAAAKAAGGDVALAGSIIWSEAALGWIADWRLSTQGRTYQWHIEGVNFDAAFRNAMGGAAQIPSGNGAPD